MKTEELALELYAESNGFKDSHCARGEWDCLHRARRLFWTDLAEYVAVKLLEAHKGGMTEAAQIINSQGSGSEEQDTIVTLIHETRRAKTTL